MKKGVSLKKLLTLCILVFAYITSCSDDYKSGAIIDTVEAIMESDPDSAIVLLDEVEILSDIAGKNYSRSCLLYGQVIDLMQQHTEKIQLPEPWKWQQAQQYYDKKGSPDEKARIRLYLGRSYYENKQYDEAVDTYKRALIFADQAKDLSLKGYICSYLADSYRDNEYYDEARQQYQEAADLHAQTGNVRSQVLAVRDIGICYGLEERYQECLGTFLKADSIAHILSDSDIINLITNYIGIAYSETDDLDLAESYLLKTLYTDNDTCPTYLSLSDLELKRNNFKKSRFYLQRALSNQTKDAVIYQYYLLYKAEGNRDSTLHYLEQYEEIEDSVKAEQNKSNVYEVDKRFDYYQLSLKNRNLQIIRQRYFIAALILSGLLLLGVIGFTVYRSRQRQHIYRKQMELNVKEKEYLTLLAQFKTLQISLQGHNEQNDTYLLQRSNLERLGIELFDERLRNLFQSKIGKKVASRQQRIKDSALSATDWKNLHHYTRELFPQIYTLYTNSVLVGDTYLQSFLIAFFSFDSKSEATLRNVSDDLVRQQRIRLRKLLKINDSKSILDYFRQYSVKYYKI